MVRNLSINRWHKNRAQKRYNAAEVLLSELSDCVPASNSVEKAVDKKELSEFISDWLCTLSQENRVLFLRRYWFGDSIKKLAYECNTTQIKLAARMYRLRQNLKTAMEKEGVLL